MTLSLNIDQIRRLLLIGIVAVSSSALGTAITYSFGDNLSASSIKHGDFGDIVRLSLPKNVVSLEDIWSFKVQIDSADDLVRAAFNNYVAFSSEAPANLFAERLDPTDSDAVKSIAAISKLVAADRRTALLGVRELHFELLRGWNHFVVEVQNFAGPCGTAVRFTVNDEPLRGIPISLPGESAALQVKTYKDGMRPVPHAEQALCARVGYQFFLK